MYSLNKVTINGKKLLSSAHNKGTEINKRK